MLSSSSSFAPASPMTMASSSPVSRFVGISSHTTLRYDQRRRCSWTGIEKTTRNSFPRIKTASATAYPLVLSQLNKNKDSPRPKSYQEVTKSARQMFAREISIKSKDSEISVAKVLFYIAAEDEAFLAFNREKDTKSMMNERENVPEEQSDSSLSETDSDADEELLQLGGKSISEWLSELDVISKEVEAELVSRDIGCHLVQVLEAVNAVLFDLRGFNRKSIIALEPKYSYLHSVLNGRCGTAFLFSVIYMEVCKRIGVTIVGSKVGEEFLIWPKEMAKMYPEELFKVTSGTDQSLFAIVNGRCVDDPGSMASDLTGNSLEGLEIATNRDIIGIALANLIRLHWRRATKSAHGLMLTSPLNQLNNIDSSNFPLLRPQDLRLAIAAAERLLILQPHKWALRRDLGMMLYFSREYGEAIHELSICMAFAPEEESNVLETFVERLHLLRLISSLKSPHGSGGRLTVP